jgi:hypothetical protein
MTPIQNPMIPLDGLFFGQGQGTKASQKGAVKSDFDLLLATFDLNNSKSKNTISGSAMDILGVTDYSAFGDASGIADMSGGSPVSSMIDMYSALMARMIKPSQPGSFPLSSEFEATFGSGGPLPDFITDMSARLRLTAAQNQAFQDIAIKHKDATRSDDTIRQIAQELKDAGIG